MKTMKKLLACSVAALMAASMMTACGDSEEEESSSVAETTTTTAAEEESSEEEEESSEEEEESSEEEESTEDESTEDESTEDSEEEEEAAEPRDISEMPGELQGLETASLVFDSSMDPSTFAKAMCEQNFENDESDVAISIEEVEGVSLLKVEVLDLNDAGTAYKIPKVQLDMSVIFEGQTDVLADIFTIDVEFVTKAVGNFVADDGTESLVPGNFMGCLATQTGSDPDNLGWHEIDSGIADSEWVSEWGVYYHTIRPGLLGPFEATDSTQYLTFMRWSIPNQADFYIADITFYDENGNILPCSIGEHAEV